MRIFLKHTDSGIDLPYISDELLHALDSKFPNSCPNLQDSDREIWFKAGQRSVVEYVEDQKQRQEVFSTEDGGRGRDLRYMDILSKVPGKSSI